MRISYRMRQTEREQAVEEKGEPNDKCRRMSATLLSTTLATLSQTSPPAIVIFINVALSAAHGGSSTHLAAARASVHFVKSLQEVATMPKISTSIFMEAATQCLEDRDDKQTEQGAMAP